MTKAIIALFTGSRETMARRASWCFDSRHSAEPCLRLFVCRASAFLNLKQTQNARPPFLILLRASSSGAGGCARGKSLFRSLSPPSDSASPPRAPRTLLPRRAPSWEGHQPPRRSTGLTFLNKDGVDFLCQKQLI